MGVDELNRPDEAAYNPPGYLAYVAAAAFMTFALYSSLEAGLSSYIYRGLKPAETPKPV